MATFTDVLEAALALPQAERVRLAHALLVSLDGGEDQAAAAAWADEIERRMKEVDDGTAVFEEWDGVRDRVASRLRARKA